MSRLVVDVRQLAELIEQALRRYELEPDIRVGTLLNRLEEANVLMGLREEAKRMGTYLPLASFYFELPEDDPS